MDASCRAVISPRDALHARQQMQGPCYFSGANWRRLRRLVGGGALRSVRGEALLSEIQNQHCYWHQSYRRSLKLSRLIHLPYRQDVFQRKSTWTLNSAGSILVETANCTVQFARSRLLLLFTAGMGSRWCQPCPQPVAHAEAKAPTAATVRGTYMYTSTSPHFASPKSALARCSCVFIPFTASPEDSGLTAGHHGDR